MKWRETVIYLKNIYSAAMGVPRVSKMWVHTVDENGKDLGDGHWVDIPKPDNFAFDGFAHIESYVSRLLQSPAKFTSLIISTPDHQMAVTLLQRDGIPQFTLSVDWRSQADRERAIRQFFAERKLLTAHDYLAGNGSVPDAIRFLGYILPPDARFVITLTQDVLRRIYRLDEQNALDFSYQEHKPV